MASLPPTKTRRVSSSNNTLNDTTTTNNTNALNDERSQSGQELSVFEWNNYNTKLLCCGSMRRHTSWGVNDIGCILTKYTRPMFTHSVLNQHRLISNNTFSRVKYYSDGSSCVGFNVKGEDHGQSTVILRKEVERNQKFELSISKCNCLCFQQHQNGNGGYITDVQFGLLGIDKKCDKDRDIKSNDPYYVETVLNDDVYKKYGGSLCVINCCKRKKVDAHVLLLRLHDTMGIIAQSITSYGRTKKGICLDFIAPQNDDELCPFSNPGDSFEITIEEGRFLCFKKNNYIIHCDGQLKMNFDKYDYYFILSSKRCTCEEQKGVEYKISSS